MNLQVDWNKSFLFNEFLLSIGLAVGLRIWGQTTILDALIKHRQALYVTIISTSISLFGFALTAIPILAILGQTNQFRILRDSGHYPVVFHVYFQAIQWLGVTAFWGVIGLVADTEGSPKIWITTIMLWLIILDTLRVYRCIWVLWRMTEVAILPSRRDGI